MTIDELYTKLNNRFDRVESRFDGVEGRLDRMESRLDAVESRLDHVEDRLNGVENRLANLEGGTEALEEKVHKTGLVIENDIKGQAKALADNQTLMEHKIIREVDSRVRMLYKPLEARVTATEAGIHELQLKVS